MDVNLSAPPRRVNVPSGRFYWLIAYNLYSFYETYTIPSFACRRRRNAIQIDLEFDISICFSLCSTFLKFFCPETCICFLYWYHYFVLLKKYERVKNMNTAEQWYPSPKKRFIRTIATSCREYGTKTKNKSITNHRRPRILGSSKTDGVPKEQVNSYIHNGGVLSDGYHGQTSWSEVTAVTPMTALWQICSHGGRRRMHREVLVRWQRGLWSSFCFYSMGL